MKNESVLSRLSKINNNSRTANRIKRCKKNIENNAFKTSTKVFNEIFNDEISKGSSQTEAVKNSLERLKNVGLSLI